MSAVLPVWVFLLSFASSSLASVIIPEEVSSWLASALPKLNKGTDSRVGFGFAFGNHADFQVILELGPQNQTQVLSANGFQSGSSNAKRQAKPLLSEKYNKNKDTVWEDMKRLYKIKSEATKKMGVSGATPKRSEEQVKKITEDLSNVDLD